LYFAKMKRMILQSSKLKRLLNKKAYEVTILDQMRAKRGFVFLIKNCVIKSKFKNFINKAIQRLYEKGFEKIKENNWIVEERKEMLELIIRKRQSMVALRVWSTVNKRYQAIKNMLGIYEHATEL
jgi:hypothetical protein